MMRINQKQKELIKVYIVIFAVIFSIINWDRVSWLFNYRAMSGLVQDVLYPQQNGKVMNQSDVIPNSNLPSPAQKNFYNRENYLEIPAIGITAPVVRGRTTDIRGVKEELDKGVVYYPGSVEPGKNGHIIMLGHSAPANWPKIKYDWVFSNINNLKNGDTIALYFDNARYTYRVFNKEFIHKGQDLSVGEVTDKNVITLISCWPPGKDQDRIAVSAVLEI